MKFVVLCLPLFVFSSFAEMCIFKGKVHPENKYEEVSNLYKLSCEWFISHFESYPDPEIVLTDVYYIDNWDSVLFINGRPSGILYGYFHKFREKKNTNIIYLELSEKEAFKKADILNQSFLFHELIHYFIKAANFEKLSNNNYSDAPMHEAIAYYAQDQFIQIITKGEKALFDFFDLMLKDQLVSTGIHSFPGLADMLYTWKPGSFILGAIKYFESGVLDKYNMLINGSYIRPQF